MEKPPWLVRSSRYVIDTPHLRLRADEIELPDGTIIPDYFVRESRGFAMVFALTPSRDVVLVRQYRYGNDAIGIELPAGTIDGDEDPLDCAQRELAEETGYTAAHWEPLACWPAEPVRSTSLLHAYLAFDARQTRPQQLEPSEHLDVLVAPIAQVTTMVRDGRIASLACVALIYAALDRLGG